MQHDRLTWLIEGVHRGKCCDRLGNGRDFGAHRRHRRAYVATATRPDILARVFRRSRTVAIALDMLSVIT